MRPMREKIFGIAIFFALPLFLNFCAAPAAHAAEAIKIGGVGGALRTMKMLASAFERSHPGIKVEVLSSIGTSGALKAVPDGAIDIGLLGVSWNKEELPAGTTATKYARTPFIFVTRRAI